MDDLLNQRPSGEGLKGQKTEPEKEGIEKIDLPPRYEYETQPDGSVKEKVIPQWEVRARGVKYVKELRGIFKDSAPQMMHDGWKEWNAIGEEKITRPDGSVDTVRADKVQMYREHPGFCVTATRPTFNVDVPWEGSMKRRGLMYSKTIYRDGQAVIVEER